MNHPSPAQVLPVGNEGCGLGITVNPQLGGVNEGAWRHMYDSFVGPLTVAQAIELAEDDMKVQREDECRRLGYDHSDLFDYS